MIAEKLEAIANGTIDRLMVNMPPRHGKSELASRRFPAFLLGTNPEIEIVVASYNADKAREFGYEVRDIVRSDEYRALFPGVQLKEDSRAADRWNTDAGGSFRAVGIGTALTGRGADVLLIDDPIKDDEEADSELRRDRIWSWYSSVAYTRLSPGGRVIVIQCMTGDTPVLLADGSEKPLREVALGDVVATYENGAISSAKVLNWANQGPDRVFEIKMKSGITVRANARHPFLVDEGGEIKWQRTASLKKGSSILRVTGANGEALSAQQTGVPSLQGARATAIRTIVNIAGPLGIDRLLSTLSHAAKLTFAIGTESAWTNTSGCCPNGAAFAQSAGSHQQVETHARIGTGNSASTTATTASAFAACSAMIATLRLGMGKLRKCLWPQRNMYGIARDSVVDIVDAGVEDVFDIEVERTANFIANGLVSHNTRWHEDDLTGRLLAEQAKGGDRWDILELPAVSAAGDALWPDRYPLEHLERIQRVTLPRHWSALYQQRPAPEEGAYFKRAWFNWYDEPPKHLRIYGASDYAVTDGDGDYTVHIVVGLDPDDNLYVLDLWRQQTDPDVWISAWLDLVRYHRPMMWAEESGQILKSIGPFLEKRMREQKTYCRREQFASAADKPTRSRSIQARASMKKVYLPNKAPWLADFLGELTMFPAGKHDDMVDAFGLIGRMLDDMVKAYVPKVEKKPANDGYRSVRPASVESWRV